MKYARKTFSYISLLMLFSALMAMAFEDKNLVMANLVAGLVFSFIANSIQLLQIEAGDPMNYRKSIFDGLFSKAARKPRE